MATLALWGLATAIGPAITGIAGATVLFGSLTAGALYGAIGGAIGAVLDSYLFPRVFGKDQGVEGPKIQNVLLQGASEGQDMKRCYGPFCRTSGDLIWQSPFKVDKIVTSGGGGGGGKGFGGGGGVTSTTYEASVSVAIAVCRNQTNNIKKIWADSKVIYEAGIKDKRVEDIVFHLGTATQDPDSTIEAFEGAGNVPAYRGVTYVVFKNLKLRDFGNRIPRFTFLVEEKYDKSVAETIADICLSAGMTTEEFNVDGVSQCLTGYTVGQVTNAARMIEPLMLAYDLTSKERAGVLYFFERSKADTGVISLADLAVKKGDTAQSDAPYSSKKLGDLQVPNRVYVDFIDPSIDFQRGSVVRQRAVARSREASKVDLPLVLTAEEADQVAARLLALAEIERHKITASGSSRLMEIEVSDVIQVPNFEQESIPVRITKMTHGDNREIRFEGVRTDLSALSQFGYADDGSFIGTPSVPPDLFTFMLDIPPLREEDCYEPVLYFTSTAVNPSGRFTSSLLISSADETNWNTVAVLGAEGYTGVTENALPVWPRGRWDRSNTLVVNSLRGDFVSAPESEVLESSNTLLLFDDAGNYEIIAFSEAEDVGDNTFILSNIVRGLRDTTPRLWPLGAKVVLLDQARIGLHAYQQSYVGQNRFYRGIASGNGVDDEESVAIIPAANNLRCFAPANFTGERIAGNNIVFTWDRRSRVPSIPFAVNEGNLEEPNETYVIRVYRLGTLTPNSPYVINDVTEWEYTAAMQTADGVSLGATIVAEIRQIGQIAGEGNPAETTV